MLPSGNDAAFTIAEYLGKQILEKRKVNTNSKAVQDDLDKWERLQKHSYFTAQVPSVRAFLKEMNKHAFALGMYDTFYDSPHGLSNKRNFSTAYDVCKLAQECMKIPVFRQVVATRIFEAKALNGVTNAKNISCKQPTRYKWESTNRLLGCMEGLIGTKTGITPAAGPCFCGYFEKDDYKLALVLCNSRHLDARWIEIQKMVHWVQRATKARRAALKEKKKKGGPSS